MCYTVRKKNVPHYFGIKQYLFGLARAKNAGLGQAHPQNSWQSKC